MQAPEIKTLDGLWDNQDGTLCQALQRGAECLMTQMQGSRTERLTACQDRVFEALADIFGVFVAGSAGHEQRFSKCWVDGGVGSGGCHPGSEAPPATIMQRNEACT